MASAPRVLQSAAAAGAAIVAALTVGAGIASAHDWTGVARCESGGDWHLDTGNGFYGGLQFRMATWREYGGRGNPAHATRAEQVRVAERVLAGQGIGAWPVCGAHLRPGTDPSQLLPAGSLETLDPAGSLGSAGSPGSAGPLGAAGPAGSFGLADAADRVIAQAGQVRGVIADIHAAFTPMPESTG